MCVWVLELIWKLWGTVKRKREIDTESFVGRFLIGPIGSVNHGPPLVDTIPGLSPIGIQAQGIEPDRGELRPVIRVWKRNPRSSSLSMSATNDGGEHRVRPTNCFQIAHLLSAQIAQFRTPPNPKASILFQQLKKKMKKKWRDLRSWAEVLAFTRLKTWRKLKEVLIMGPTFENLAESDFFFF